MPGSRCTCGRANPPDARFCPACGRPLPVGETEPSRVGAGATGAGGGGAAPPPRPAPGADRAADPSAVGGAATGTAPVLPAPLRLPAVGTLLGGRFVVEARLGAGGMGAVFRAHDTELGRPVALKFLLGVSAAELERFRREARTIAGLDHPRIVHLYDRLDTEFGACLVMQLVAGESLFDRLAREQKLPLAAAIGIAVQVCEGLAYAHRYQVIHRDVKPGNLLLPKEGGVKIADFGIARGLGEASGGQIGTPGYMAPEQEEGGTIDYRTDLYAVGLLLYHMITGERPRVLHLDRLPGPVREVVARAAAHDVADRYDTARDLQAALEAAAAAAAAAGVEATDGPGSAAATACPVAMTAVSSNAGVMLYFQISGAQAEEIFCRVGDDGDLKSTGFLPGLVPTGGKRTPSPTLNLGFPQGTLSIHIKYRDVNGRWHGPFRLPYDPVAAAVEWTRHVLGVTENSWIALRDWGGKLLVYFTHLLCYRQALAEVRFSVDDETLAKTFPLLPVDPRSPHEIPNGQLCYVEVPATTKFVCVKLKYKDGTESEVKRFAGVSL